MPSLLAPARTFWNFGLGYDGRFTLWTALALLPLVLITLVGIWHRSEPVWWLCMIAWLAVLPSVALMLSFVLGPMYVDRYLSICVPAYLLLLAVGVVRFPRPRLRRALGVLLLVTMTVFALGILSGNRVSKPDWRGATAHVVEQAQPGDELLVDARGFFVTSYYVGQTLPIRRLDSHSACIQIDTALRESERLWLLFRDPTESPHSLGRARPFDPYVFGDSQVTTWLVDHADQIEREWLLNGVFLALVGPSGAEEADHRG
jgi:hypothetical protein